MMYFEDSELKKQKALANRIIEELKLPYEKISRECLKNSCHISYAEQYIEQCDNLKSIVREYKKNEVRKKEFAQHLAIRDRIKTLIDRNKKREKFIKAKLDEAGIYNDKVKKKDIDEMERQEMENITPENFNINKQGEPRKTLKYFNGDLLSFVGNKIDMSDTNNLDILKNSSDENFHKIIFAYPSLVGEIPPHMLVDTKFKKRMLREVVAFASEKSVTQNFKEINKSLGSPLSFKSEITEDLESFMAGIQNTMNVKTCVFLAEKHPYNKGDIAALKVNYKSELIPSSVKVAVLANGLSGDAITTEEQLSEELKISEQKTNLQNMAIENNLENLGSENENDFVQEQKEKEEERDKIKANEERKKLERLEKENKEKAEKAKMSEEDLMAIEKMLGSLRKDDD